MTIMDQPHKDQPNQHSLQIMRKVELHQHLELSLRPSTIRELAPAFGIDLPDDKSFRARFLIEEPMKDLGSVLNKFLDTQLLLASEEILERVSFEVCEDAFFEGVRVLELRYAPTFVRYRHDHLSFDQIHSAIVRGCQAAEKKYGMAVGLICIIQRILPIKEAEFVTDFAIDHRETFVALDLADNEEGFDSKPFSPFFLRAKKAGLGITVHAGEVNTAKSPTYPKDAIEHLGATRIGHGVQVARDPQMIQYIKEKQAVLELCITSNYLTQAVPGQPKDHPFKKLLDAGVLVTLNTDDPGIFSTNITREYQIAVTQLGLTVQDLVHCNEVALKASFINKQKKQSAWSASGL